MKILAIDIETTPTLAYVWRPYKENVGVDQIVTPGGVFTFAARWLGEKKTVFHADWIDGHEGMIQAAWELLDEADVLLHYNGRKFDTPHLQREFMQMGLTPPSPFKEIDLLETVKKQARFFMNKLAHVAPELGLKGKLDHEGFPLWTKCMQGDAAAQKRMEKYNRRDVLELIEAYELLQPWIKSHPSHAAFTQDNCCPKCGSDDLKKKGFAHTMQSKFQKYVCGNCGGWSRSTIRENKSVHIVQVV